MPFRRWVGDEAPLRPLCCCSGRSQAPLPQAWLVWLDHIKCRSSMMAESSEGAEHLRDSSASIQTPAGRGRFLHKLLRPAIQQGGTGEGQCIMGATTSCRAKLPAAASVAWEEAQRVIGATTSCRAKPPAAASVACIQSPAAPGPGTCSKGAVHVAAYGQERGGWVQQATPKLTTQFDGTCNSKAKRHCLGSAHRATTPAKPGLVM